MYVGSHRCQQNTRKIVFSQVTKHLHCIPVLIKHNIINQIEKNKPTDIKHPEPQETIMLALQEYKINN